jgi:hypothetical protein
LGRSRLSEAASLSWPPPEDCSIIAASSLSYVKKSASLESKPAVKEYLELPLVAASPSSTTKYRTQRFSAKKV